MRQARLGDEPATEPPRRIVLMKYGFHGTEAAGAILGRKRRELEESGRIYWGYNGVLCDPRKQVQAFCASTEEPVHLALSPTPSPLHASGRAAERWSSDREAWSAMPEGVRVLDSAKALVADSMERVDLTLDLADYAVGVGPKEGRGAAEHLRFRVDKACLARREGSGPSRLVKVDHLLRLAPPYAVYLA